MQGKENKMDEKILKENYIFLSYSHENRGIVNTIANKIENDGYCVWYDNGINPGSEWAEDIAVHIEKAKVFIAFITKEYLQSENCKDELSYARENNLVILLVFLDKELEISGGMKLRNHRRQQLFYYKYSDKNDFYSKLYSSDEINLCNENSREKLQTDNCALKENESENINIDSLYILSKAGNAEATYKLAKCFQTGKAVDMDKCKAFELYEIAKNQGSVLAITELGCLYNYGVGCKRNKKKAFNYYLEAADKGELKALSIIAEAYENGNNVKKSKKKAWKFYNKAYNAGLKKAAGEIGYYYLKGIRGVVKQDIKKAIEYFEIAIASGYTEYVVYLAGAYLDSDHNFNPQKAENLLLDNQEADLLGRNWYLLGMCYFQGNGVRQDKAKGIEYLKKSADIGVYPDAAYELGRIFKDGDGAYKNIDLAEEYYERAADIDYSFTKPKIILKTKNGREKLIKFVGLCIIINIIIIGGIIIFGNKKVSDSTTSVTKIYSNMMVDVSNEWKEIANITDDTDVDFYFSEQNQLEGINISVIPYYIGDKNIDFSDYDNIIKYKYESDNKTKIILVSGIEGYCVEGTIKYDGEERYFRNYLFIYKNELYQITCFTTNPPSEKFIEICQRLEASIKFKD